MKERRLLQSRYAFNNREKFDQQGFVQEVFALDELVYIQYETHDLSFKRWKCKNPAGPNDALHLHTPIIRNLDL